MRTTFLQRAWRAFGQAHFVPQSRGAIVMVALLLASTNLFASAFVSRLSGGPNPALGIPSAGYVDGDITTNSEYNTPCGIAVDLSGNYLFVADGGSTNNAIRLLEFDINWTSTLLTLSPDGLTVVTNLFNHPIGVAIDSSYNLFVLNRGNGSNGNVLQFAIDEFLFATLIATNAANLTNAAGLALDFNDNIYVTIKSNTVLRISPFSYITNFSTVTNITPTSTNIVTITNITTITTVATNLTIVATVANAGASLQGLVVKNSGLYKGMLAVCDSGRNGIYLINPINGVVSTNAGFHGVGDFINTAKNSDPLSIARFFQPSGVAETGDGSLIVTDFGNHRVKVVTRTGVTNLYGVRSNYWYGPYPGLGTVNGTVYVPDNNYNDVQSRLPFGVVIAPDGTVYVTEKYWSVIREVTGANIKPPLNLPLAPTGLTATTNDGQVILTWTASPGATNYNIKRSMSIGGPYTIIGSTTATSYTDTKVLDGMTYYYVVSALNAVGESANSLEVSARLPFPPPPDPRIGWFDYEVSGVYAFSVLHPVGIYIAHNDLNLAIDPTTNGIATFYITANGPLPVLAVPSATNGTTPPFYQENYMGYLQPLPVTTVPDLVVKAVNVNSGGSSAIVTAEFLFQVGNPNIIGNNAAQFQVSDITTNVTLWYTIDGTDPTNGVSVASDIVFVSINGSSIKTNYFPIATFSVAGTNYLIITTNGSSITTNSYPTNTTSLPVAVLITNGLSSIGPISITNGLPVTLSLTMSSNLLFRARAFRPPGYSPSGIASQLFTPANYVPNTICFGFDSGEASSDFVASPGQFFYAPVTLLPLSATLIYSLQFNLTVTNISPAPPIPAGSYSFESMLKKPDPENPGYVIPIQPYMYISNTAPYVTNTVYYNGSTNWVDLRFADTNLNLLGVGWLERLTKTNLYDTKSQDLIAMSMAHDTLFLQSGGKVILGGYAFRVPLSATNGQTYRIQIGRPSATSDGIGAPGSSVYINAPTNGTPDGGTINAIKNVTMGQRKYIVGDAYPFRWFNAGDFGNTNLENADIEQVFQAAIYQLNSPEWQAPHSDFLDVMDSCGATYVDLGHGYLEKNTFVTDPILLNDLFNGNDPFINQIAFGDGNLDVCDVYVTYRRSLDPSLTWFRRFWTNGVLVAERTPNVFNPNVVSKSSSVVSKMAQQAGNTSVTNQPKVNFVAGDFQATAGQPIQVPITANIFGNYPVRVLMLNLTVVPLDGSPALTTPVSFSYNPALGSPWMTDQQGKGNYSAVWLNSGISGLAGNVSIGTLFVTIPANATSSSAYAVHFDHASASPNGIASFPKQTLTGLIPLSSRSGSSYNDGIPDSWRLRYFGTIYNSLSVSNADADGTGMNNWQKYIAGLDPTDPKSCLRLTAAQSQNRSINWPSVTGKTYVIQRSTTLFPPNWTTISTVMGTGTTMEYNDATGGNSYFYRVYVQ